MCTHRSHERADAHVGVIVRLCDKGRLQTAARTVVQPAESIEHLEAERSFTLGCHDVELVCVSRIRDALCGQAGRAT